MSNEEYLKAKQARNLMFKKSMLQEFSYLEIRENIERMTEDCDNLKWAYDDEETLISAFDDNEDAAQEFKLMFSELSYDLEKLINQWDELDEYDRSVEDKFNDFSVAMVGEWFRLYGFDAYRGDYFRFDLPEFEESLAVDEARKRISRKTKIEIIDECGRIAALILIYADCCQRFSYLKSVVDIFQEENIESIKLVRSINEMYKALFENSDKKPSEYSKAFKDFEKALGELPPQVWAY